MLNPINTGVAPPLSDSRSPHAGDSKVTSGAVKPSDEVHAPNSAGALAAPRAAAHAAHSQQQAHPDESSSAESKASARGLRHEWKLIGGRSGAESEPDAKASASFNASREKLQVALAKLKDRPQDRTRQDAAHDAHAALALQPMPLGHRSGAVAHKALRIGVAGAMQTFGVGRTIGLHVGASAVPVDSVPGVKNIKRGVAQLGLGSVGGAIGNFVGQTFVAPIVDRAPRKFQPVEPSAVLPDRMVAKMNRIRSGWGDETRASIAKQQHEISQLGSETNVHFGEKAFTAAMVLRTMLQPPKMKLGMPQSVAICSTVSTAAGGAVGLQMGVNMARASARIPRMESLDRVLARRPRERSEEAAMEDAKSLPLFYSHLTPADQRQSIKQAIADNWYLGDIREPEPRGPGGAMFSRERGTNLQRIGADLRNIGQSVANRSGHLMQATTVPLAITTSQPFVMSAMPNDFSSRAAGLALPAIAMNLVIRPWFKALAGGIPRHDAAMRADRQKAAEVAATMESKPSTER